MEEIDFFSEEGNSNEGVDFFSEEKEPVDNTPTFNPPKSKEELVEQVLMKPTADIIRKSEGNTIKLGQGFMALSDGVVQLSMDALESMGLIDEGATDRFTSLTNEEKKEVDSLFKKEFGDDVSFAFMEGTGQYAPLMLIPAGGQTGLARVLLGALTGGGSESVLYQPEENKDERDAERGKDVATGLVTGGLLSTALEGLTKVSNFVKGAVDKAVKINQEFAERGIELQKRTGITYKLSQLVDDPQIVDLEKIARSTPKGERLARELEGNQSKQAFKYFTRIADKLDPSRRGYGLRVKKAFDSVIGTTAEMKGGKVVKGGTGLLGKRQLNAKRNYAAAEKAGGTIQLNNFVQTIDDEIARLSLPGVSPQNTKIIDELTSIKSDILERTQGSITPTNLQALLENYGNAQKGSGKIFTDAIDNASDKRMAKKLFGSLNDDLDDAVEAGGEGAEALKKARDQYRLDTAEIQEIRDTALGKFFNTSESLTTEKIEKKLASMDASELEGLFGVLKTSDATIKEGMQAFWLRQFITKGKRAADAGSFKFIPAQMLDMNDQKNRDMFKAVFDNPNVRRQVNDGLEAVQRIVLNNATTGGKTVARLKEFAGVLASRDKTFAARLASEILSPTAIPKIVLDPEGVKALEVLSKPFDQNKWTAAFTIIRDITTKNVEEKQVEQTE